MALYAISDLHLSLGTDKPMDVFGVLWKDHHLKIQEKWNSKVNEEDIVLVAGDISWGMKLDEAMPDLDFIHRLKGRKIFIKGNHYYWWSSISKINSLYDDMNFIQNTSCEYNEYGICGTRGWVNINDEEEHDEKIYKRELIRLQMSLDSAVKKGKEKLIVMLHYPPITKISRSEEFLELLSAYKVEKIIYGHIHFDARFICINGFHDSKEYMCTSADIINFDPVRIL